MNWNISQIDQGFQNGTLAPVTAHWQCTHTDGEYSASVYSTASVSGLKEVTVEAVLAHIWANGVDKEATEKACLTQVDSQKRANAVLMLNKSVSVETPNTPLEVAQAEALKQIDDYHATVITRLVGNPTQAEKDTWSMKLSTATSISQGSQVSSAGQAFLTSADLVKGQPQLDWATGVLKKAAAYASIVGLGEKLRTTARQSVKSASTSDEVSTALSNALAETGKAVAEILKN